MSHVARVELVISNLSDLDEACKHIGTIELVRNQSTFKWYGTWMQDYAAPDAAYQNGIKPEDYGKCLHAIRVKGDANAYEIGVVKNPNGAGYVLVYDNFAGGKGMSKHVGGASCDGLKQAYARCAAIRVMGEQGYSHTEKALAGGKVKLSFQRAY